PYDMAARFVKGDVEDEDAAIAGASHIIAEWVNEHMVVRAKLRDLFKRRASIYSKLVKGKEAEAEKYKDYFDFSEPLNRTASHRFLALYRANREGVLKLKVYPDKEQAQELIHRFYVKGTDACADIVREACNDGYKRLLLP